MTNAGDWLDWNAERARDWIAVPQASDDKYSRGVLGMLTGSAEYPGAAVLGVEAAVRTGVGMVRYRGPERAAHLVLARRPEVVTAAGRVQAWLLGSGMDAGTRSDETTKAVRAALAEGLPSVVDAGCLDLVEGGGPLVVTPHFRELRALLGRHGVVATVEQIQRAPGEWAIRAAAALQVTVLVKGNVTHIASPAGLNLRLAGSTPWLATAGTGDVLGGILGALLATHAEQARDDPNALAKLAATASLLHSRAAIRASAGGPIAALDVAEVLPATIARLLGAAG
ncbi:NAD(P)H-hydrate dehydratase [Leifsonia sp. YAF41]|uniref:ADP-dependent NAD(P)H-hydrate dehydratase n=1 Tax=Leifsonia sp. YAF41 TaxID=3233086 RepID=UPI003F95D94B